jgi:hypothetical protein
MQCIICKSDIVGLEIFALPTRLRKYFIVYHKSNGMTTMKKHVEIEQKILIKKFIKDETNVVFNKLGFWRM